MTPEQIGALPYRKNVGIMLLNADGLAFVGQRLDYKGNAWQMPQGGIDEGEDPTDAAFRELHEETGIDPALVTLEKVTQDWIPYDLPLDVVPKFWGGKFRGQEQKWFRMRFLGTDDQINIDTKDPEFSAWKWMPLDQLIDNIVPFKREVYARVLHALT